MNSEIEHRELIAFHPGTYVEDIIEDLGITRKEFADRICTTEKSLARLIDGDDKLSKEMAHKLYRVTGVSVNTWMGLQEEYEKALKINARESSTKSSC